jgi:hypothetical protein
MFPSLSLSPSSITHSLTYSLRGEGGREGLHTSFLREVMFWRRQQHLPADVISKQTEGKCGEHAHRPALARGQRGRYGRNAIRPRRNVWG